MYPDRRVAVLVLSDADRLAGLAALTADLEASSSFSVEVTSDLERLLHLGSVHALFADWRGPWRTTDHVVAYTRQAGAGHFAYIGLGHQPAAYAEAGFRRVVLRCLHEPTAE